MLSAGLLVAPNLFAADKKAHYGLQLYTVRDAMAKDPAGTLAKVAQAGFNTIEVTYSGPGNFYGLAPKDFAKVVSDNGLEIVSAHYRLGEDQVNGQDMQGTMMHDWQRAVDDAAAAGVKYMVCAWLSETERGSVSHYYKVADQLNIAGAATKKAGMQLCYHNHDFEFEKQAGKVPYQALLIHADEKLVKMEVDLYWLTKAGQDPTLLFAQYPGRFPLWHLKDMDNTPKKMFTEVGNGVVDFKRIFESAKQAGLRYAFVEQDICPGDPFDSIARSISYIKGNPKVFKL